MDITFGDNVWIRATKQVEAAGVAGLARQVYGETTASAIQDHVIGSSEDTDAINVHFDGLGPSCRSA